MSSSPPLPPPELEEYLNADKLLHDKQMKVRKKKFDALMLLLNAQATGAIQQMAPPLPPPPLSPLSPHPPAKHLAFSKDNDDGSYDTDDVGDVGDVSDPMAST